MTLTDFLLARIDEDQAAAQRVTEDRSAMAKRAIVNSRLTVEGVRKTEQDLVPRLTTGGMVAGLDIALRFLALPYDSHPDYDEAWRP